MQAMAGVQFHPAQLFHECARLHILLDMYVRPGSSSGSKPRTVLLGCKQLQEQQLQPCLVRPWGQASPVTAAGYTTSAAQNITLVTDVRFSVLCKHAKLCTSKDVPAIVFLLQCHMVSVWVPIHTYRGFTNPICEHDPHIHTYAEVMHAMLVHI
jgi:hypothetical protein